MIEGGFLLPRCRSIGWILIYFALAGCATAPRDGRFHDPGGRFTLVLPGPPWQAATLDGALVSLRQPDWSAAIAVRSDCARPEPGPLASVARHLLFGLRATEVVSKEGLALAGVPAFRSHVRGRLDSDPVEIDAVTLRHGACLYDFLLVAPPAHFGAARPDFERLLSSWAPEGSP